MADTFAGERNLQFLLYEVHDAEALTRYPYFSEHNREGFEMVVQTALRLSKEKLRPYLAEMDRNPPRLVAGEIRVHPMVRAWMRQCGEGGWIAANAPFELGGLQLPLMVTGACRFLFCAANYSASVYPLLSTGAAHLIESFGSQELIDTYVPKMFEGEWQGTMALTEPQAGSSLSDVATQAEPTEQGYYMIRGQKIFISAADHDGVENVVHLMLARIQGAPPGVKGISLFVVPKKRPDEHGTLVSNDVQAAGTYHKLGYRGSPIVQLSLGEQDDCRGYLVGEPHKGLSYMFQMMNETRIDVGLSAAAIASAAYYASLEYARERPQGRKISAKDPTQPPVPIIEHADIKRMLLFQRSIVEGSLSLILQCARYADLLRVTDGRERERYALLLDFLTPIAKTYPSEMGVLSVSQGLQCLGGYGYCDEFPLEQLYRDARIHPIHEGTTGIHGLDLLGRKVTMHQGRAFRHFLEAVQETLAAASETMGLKEYAVRLGEAVRRLRKVTEKLLEAAAAGDTERFLADATLYLELCGIVAVAWQWLLQGLAVEKAIQAGPSGAEARFYQGKRSTMRYFFHYELPKIEGLAARLTDPEAVTVDMRTEWFED